MAPKEVARQGRRAQARLRLSHPQATARRYPVHADTPVPATPYSSMWAPSSTTRFGGMRKYAVALRAFLDMI